MANGVRTTNIENQVALSDEIIVNADGQTGVQSVDDFAAQMAQSGKFGYLTQSVLFATIKGRGNGAVHYTIAEGYSYVEDTENPDIVANGVYLRVLGDAVATKQLGATANDTYALISEEMVALHDYLNAGDSWDFFAIEWMVRRDGDPRSMLASPGVHIVNRSVGKALNAPSKLGNFIGSSVKNVTIKALDMASGGVWSSGDYVIDLADDGDALTRREITDILIDCNNSAPRGLNTSYTTSSGPLAEHIFRNIKIKKYTELGWLADNNDASIFDNTHFDPGTNAGAIPFRSVSAGGPLSMRRMTTQYGDGPVQIAAQNMSFIDCDLFSGIQPAIGGRNTISIIGGQIGQCAYDNAGSTEYASILVRAGEGTCGPVTAVGTYFVLQSQSADSYVLGGNGFFGGGSMALTTIGCDIAVPDPLVDGTNATLISPALTSAGASAAKIALIYTRLEDITLADVAGQLVIEYTDCQLLRCSGGPTRAVTRKTSDGNGIRLVGAGGAVMDVIAGINVAALPSVPHIGVTSTGEVIFGSTLAQRIFVGLTEHTRYRTDGGLQLLAEGATFQMGSNVVVNKNLAPKAPTFTTAQLSDAAHAINTVQKGGGCLVYNSSDAWAYFATGTSATAAWKRTDGGATITPV